MMRLRIGDDGALENADRARMLALIRGDPGVHMRELQRRTGFGWGRFHHHVRLLRSSLAVRTDRQGRRVLLYPANVVPPRLHPIQATAERLLGCVCVNPGATPKELARCVGVSRQLAVYHLRRLDRLGVVQRLPGRPARYLLGPATAATPGPAAASRPAGR
jgi:predicted transcriptional regulator